MTFEAWLKKQIKRNDPIGDLARDFFGAKKLRGNRFEKCDEKHLRKWSAMSIVYKVLEDARKEFKETN